MIRRGVVDVVSGGGKAALHPSQQLRPLLLAELHLAHGLVQRSAQLFHLAVPLIGQQIVYQHQRAVLRKVRQQGHQRRALLLIQPEDVQIRHHHHGVLGHHGHGLRHLCQFLHCQSLAGEPVVVELLEARRDQQPVQLLQIVAPQIRLLSVEQVYVLWGLCLQIRPQAIEAVVLFFSLRGHGQSPPCTVTKIFPCRSVR